MEIHVGGFRHWPMVRPVLWRGVRSLMSCVRLSLNHIPAPRECLELSGFLERWGVKPGSGDRAAMEYPPSRSELQLWEVCVDPPRLLYVLDCIAELIAVSIQLSCLA